MSVTELYKMFFNADKDNDGKLSFIELQEFIRNIIGEEDCSSEKVKELMIFMGKTEDETIEFHEMVLSIYKYYEKIPNWVETIRENKKLTTKEIQEIKSIFIEKNEKFSLEKLIIYLLSLKSPVPIKNVKDLTKELDKTYQ